MEVMQEVPSSVQQPSNSNESVRPEAKKGEERHHAREGHLPNAETTTAEVRGSSSGQHNCIKLLPIRLLDRRIKKDVSNRD